MGYIESTKTLKKLKHFNMYLKSSQKPTEDIAVLSSHNSDQYKKMYRTGYENYFESLPVLEEPFLESKVKATNLIMQLLAHRLISDEWVKNSPPNPGEFHRTILALEAPSEGHEGTELVVGQWGPGMSSHVHGHAPGYLHEEILYGRLRVNTYGIVKGKARPVHTVVAKGAQTFASLYSKPDPEYPRAALVHNFVALEESATLHYLPEHARDARDNKFEVEWFEDLDVTDLAKIDTKAAIYSAPGDVLLVRSHNVPDYGDHFVVITGPPIQKDHGIRPQDHSIQAGPIGSKLLDIFDGGDGFTLLKLSKEKAGAFLSFTPQKILK